VAGVWVKVQFFLFVQGTTISAFFNRALKALFKIQGRAMRLQCLSKTGSVGRKLFLTLLSPGRIMKAETGYS